MSITTRIERLARLRAIPDDDQIDPALAKVGRMPERRRVLTDAGFKPVVPMEDVLVHEVERTARAHEAALEDLRRYRLSHDTTER